MKYIWTMFSIGLLAAGCGSEQLTEPVKPVAIINDDAATYDPADSYDIGDVEATVQVSAMVPPQEIPLNAEVEELRTADQRLTSMRVDFRDTAPKTLPIQILTETRTDFSRSPVVLRGKLIREIEKGEKEILFTFETLIDVQTFKRREPPSKGKYPCEFTTDGLAGLSEMPPTMLLYVEVDAYLSELGTEAGSIDIATFEGTADDTSILLSNALRINYAAPESEASTESVSAEATPAEATSAETAPAELAPAEPASAEAAPVTPAAE